MNDERFAQLGVIEVPVAALGGGGDTLVRFLEPLQLNVPSEFADSGAPPVGWRVLPASLNRDDVVMIGAPTKDGHWFLGQLIERDGRWEFAFHGPIARHPSKVERRAGLQLRWPKAVAGVPVDQVFVDVLNNSSERWTPTPLDDFHTVGILVASGASTENSPSYSFGYVGGQSTAFILDPGEYARVHVNVPSPTIIDAGVGRHSLHASVPSMSMASDLPLSLTITKEDVEKATPRRTRPPQSPPAGSS